MQRADTTQIEQSLMLLVDPGSTFEIRALEERDTLSGYFVNPHVAAQAIARSCSSAIGVYTTLNPVRPELRARCSDRIAKVGKKGATTNDNNIVRRRHLLIDIDGVPVAGISASDAEHEAAIHLASEIEHELAERGWPRPLRGDSGNGAHLVYAIDLPTESDLVGLFLDAAQVRWGCKVGDVTLKIDTQNRNPARITKVFGTWARKGDNLPERPHRMARILSAPDVLSIVTEEQLRSFVAEFAPPVEPKRAATTGSRSTVPKVSKTLDVAEWLARHGVGVKSMGPWDGKQGPGTCYELEVCPFNSDHTRGEAFVVQHASGAITAKCHHESCKWEWEDLRERYEPRAQREARREAPRIAAAVSGEETDHPNAPVPDREQPDWGEPKPVGDHLPPVPAFDVRLLPADMQSWVIDIAERASVSIDLVAVAAMCAIAPVAAYARTIRPKRHDPWRVYPNIWGVGIAHPGTKKSYATSEAFKPLHVLEMRSRAAFKQSAAERETEALIAKAKKDALRAQITALAKGSKNAVPIERADITKALAENTIEKQRPRRYVAQDATVEKIADMVDRGASKRSTPIAVLWDELLGLFRGFDRDGHEGDRAFYLQGWSVGNFLQDRISRGEMFVRDLCLCVYGNTQPEPFEAYVREAFSGAGADGFLQRFQMMVYPDRLPRQGIVDRHKDSMAERRAMELFERLADLEDEDDDGKPPALRFADDAQQFFFDWLNELEDLIADERVPGVLQAHFGKYRSLMPAIALICHLASGRGTENTPVSLWAAQQAASWCSYLKAHAERVFSLVLDAERAAASMLAKKIERGELQGVMRARDVARKYRTFQSETVDGALELLEELGWVRLAEVKKRGRGRPSLMVAFNPRARRMVGKAA